jgi:hypothetical protein
MIMRENLLSEIGFFHAVGKVVGTIEIKSKNHTQPIDY